MIRVAQILGNMNSGGVEAVVMNYYRAIDKSNIQFDFFLSEESDFPQRSEIETLGGTFYFLPKYTKVFAYQKRLQALLQKNHYDIAHVHLSTMSVFALFAAMRAGVKVRICHNHSTASWQEPKKTLLKYLLRPWCKPFATAYFACGQQAATWLYGKGCVARSKVYLQRNAIDTTAFAPCATARDAIRTEFGIAPTDFCIGHIGRFDGAKNHVFLIEMFYALYQQHPNAKLLLVGEGALQDAVKAQVTALGLSKQVIFAGVRRDTNRFYSAFDVFCLPSNYEGFPVVVTEAASANLPIFTSDQVSAEIECFATVRRLPLAILAWTSALSGTMPTQHNEVSPYDITNCAAALLQQYRSLLQLPTDATNKN